MVKKIKRIYVGDVLVRIVTYNNKSRKGRYVYLRDKQGRQGIYKYRKINGKYLDLDSYYSIYNKDATATKWGIRYKKDRLHEIAKRSPLIEQILGEGIGTGHISKAKLWDNYSVRQTYKEMLKNVVKDRQLRHIITSQGNVQKYKMRIETTISIEGTNGKQLAELRCYDKSLEEVREHLKIMLTNIDTEKIAILKREGFYTSPDTMNLKSGEVRQVGDIKITISYAKAKRNK